MPTAKTKRAKQITKDEVLTTRARKVLFDCLLAGMKVKDAAKEAGLSYGYARKWIAESNVNPLVVQEKKVESQELREEATQTLVTIMRDPHATHANKIKCIDVIGKMNGWHSQTTVLEAGQRQKQLTEAEREEARRLAELRFRPEYAIPDTHRSMSAQEAVFEPVNEGVSGCEAGVNQADSGCADALQVPKEAGLAPLSTTPLPPNGPTPSRSPLCSENFFGQNTEGSVPGQDISQDGHNKPLDTVELTTSGETHG